MPLDGMRSEGHEVTALFFNPNIHPYSEYLRRLDSFTVYAKDNDVPVLTVEQRPLAVYAQLTGGVA